ncbi:flagellar basal-body MS-ring/collar protein FliF [Desulfatitalea alkaliphila]|uniref:Flagellar M-ring protein n=1 Tax=Desulfatitalea alkaliphila TaxID=2929485 RepID=A0AA41R5N9_9BACT|nr:flagellar basal-body MS-ring/collar protein FliF [Desulfatitalea alkaliphila]MCJ8501311.1 flagellar M-ring protein FliF [Desulfatitalea alkaliphila]
MPNSFGEILQQLKGILQTLSPGKMLTLFLLVGTTVVGLVMMVSWSGRTDFAPLYHHMAPEDAGQVVAALREKKIDYKLSHDGGTIQIPRSRLYEVRLDLASQGLPRGGSIGFELFDDTKLGQTEFAQNINYQRALQGELSRTINGLAEVESSRVHIVMPQSSLFIREEEPASASITLRLRHGRWLSDDQVQGIVHLVSSSVPRLVPDKVTVVDQNGKMLAGFEEAPTAAKRSADHLEFQQRKERALEKQIVTMLESVLGEGKAIVRVACALDFVEQEQTEEIYMPDNQVVRSEQLLSQRSTDPGGAPMGVPGLAPNIARDQAVQNQAGRLQAFQKDDQTRNYEIGRTTRRQIMPVGQVQRLSVAVVVDGRYEAAPATRGRAAEPEYIPRTAEEMASLDAIVKSAINFDEARGDKVELANIPFNTQRLGEPPEMEGNRWLDQLREYGAVFKYLAVALFLLFTFMYVIRPLIAWLTETAWEDVELLEHLPRSLAEIERQYAAQGDSSSYVKQAAQVIAANQEDSGRLMQQWLKEQK